MNATFLPSSFDYRAVGNVVYFDYESNEIAETHMAPGDTHVVTAVWQDSEGVWVKGERLKSYGKGRIARGYTPEGFMRLMRRFSQVMQVPILDLDTPPAWAIVSAAQVALNCGGTDSREARVRLLMIRSIRRVSRRVCHVYKTSNNPKWIRQALALYESLQIAHESEMNLRLYGRYATDESLVLWEKAEAEWDTQPAPEGLYPTGKVEIVDYPTVEGN